LVHRSVLVIFKNDLDLFCCICEVETGLYTKLNTMLVIVIKVTSVCKAAHLHSTELHYWKSIWRATYIFRKLKTVNILQL